MSLIRLNGDNFESFTLTTNPKKTFISSSLGVTGSTNLFVRHSSIEKEIVEVKQFNTSSYNDFSLQQHLLTTIDAGLTSSNILGNMTRYMQLVNLQPQSSKKLTQLSINRSVPTQDFSFETLKKATFKNTLMPNYRVSYPNAHYGYTNYNCLNFFTASSVPSDTALIYPSSSSLPNSTFASGSYMINGGFTFEFFINPKYTTDQPGGHFHAGTIFHLSSCYAVSLITGSSRDENGFPNTYRLMLQLSHSADTKPSKIRMSTIGNFPNEMVYVSNDNALKRNHWSHCIIRWGTNNVNAGSGSFMVNLENAGDFVLTSSTFCPVKYGGAQGNPDALIVGNYYEGNNVKNDGQNLFFAQRPSLRDGLLNMAAGSTRETPGIFKLEHPLNAEIHELKIYNSYRHSDQIYSSSQQGLDRLERDLVFYLPPFFVKESPRRTSQNGTGGILETPFIATDGTTDTPINVPLSFRIGVKDINLENFVRDFRTGNYPRLFNLTSSQIVRSTNTALSASNFMYATGSFVKRNLSILPCDNGKFIPNFDLLKSGSTAEARPQPGSLLDRYVNSFGNLDLSMITLENLIETGSLPAGSTMRNSVTRGQNLSVSDLQSDSIYESMTGVDHKTYYGSIGPYMSSFLKTRDNSSNEVTFYDISNIFYGYKINPKTFEIKDTNITGSNGKIQITLKDNGFGSLYRADALTPHPTWASVGTIFYNEGLVGILSPHISYHGKNGYEINFNGEQSIHIQKINILAPGGMINSSSNTTYNPLISASLDAHNDGEEFVYISSINLHDENLNVVGKTIIAQPVTKRHSDRYLFKIKMDF